MPAKPILEKKVRWILALIALMVLAIPIFAVRRYIAKVGESKVHAIRTPTDERIVAIDGRIMLIQPEALGQTMAEWLKAQKDKTFSFEFSDRSFVANSETPSAITVKRIHEVARLTQASPSIVVHILMPTHFVSVAAQKLDEQRAASFRNALITDGVSASHVTVGRAQWDTPKSVQLAVLLAK